MRQNPHWGKWEDSPFSTCARSDGIKTGFGLAICPRPVFAGEVRVVTRFYPIGRLSVTQLESRPHHFVRKKPTLKEGEFCCCSLILGASIELQVLGKPPTA